TRQPDSTPRYTPDREEPVWLATNSGGCSGDVLALRINEIAQRSFTPEFLYYLLSSDGFFAYSMQHAKGAKMPRGNKAAILNFRIPVPPLEVQREIVRILDKFTALEAELEAELEARRAQYAHYRDALLSFTQKERVRWATLSGLLKEPLANGRSIKDGNGYPVLRLTALHGPVVDVREQKLGAWDEATGRRFRIEAGDLLFARGNGSKELLARACMVEQAAEVAFPDTMIRARPNLDLVSQRYLFYIWESRPVREKIEQIAKVTSGVWKVSQNDLGAVVLPVPPVEEQERIVGILSKFDALVNDLSSGLPAEIEARRQQYSYYRDRLLTFKEAAA
ncbi:restriction endonuclease subunit S, partial [Propionibacterium sp.]|uniref:restriction endonuclease subunit S n=1 Tax=Propionibacterium sp. TaxID=1977903 RepID=UPI0039E90A2D